MFSDFSEVEKDVEANAPPVVYKYRSWKDSKHKRLLTEQEIWFSHPFDLNDPLDVRVPMKFNYEEVKDQRYLRKILDGVREKAPHLTTDEERTAEAHRVWEQTKANPAILDENLKLRSENRENFNSYGVFSTSKDGLDEKTWEEYGYCHAGYCLGFKTIELCRAQNQKSMYGYVEYCDAPHDYSFFDEDKRSKSMARLFLKKKSWGYEKEFRFISAGIGHVVDGEPNKRAKSFPVTAVAEVILGYDISKEDEAEILAVINEKYPKDLPIYKTKRDELGGLTKIRIR